MKRKLLTALLVAALAGTTAMGIAACDKGHEHTFSDKWETNETQHWHKATCEHTDEKGSLGNHVYDNDADTDCNVCGYTRTVDNGSTDVFTAPTVNVLADPVEITAGEEFNYIEALDVSDEYDEADALNFSYTAEPELDLSDPAEGTYVLTITVTNSKGKSTTVTMNVTVTAPLPSLVVEVETERDVKHWVTDGGHESGKMVFAGDKYIVIDENTKITEEEGTDSNGKKIPANVVYYQYAVTGVFHNTLNEEVVVHMNAQGGETAILDSTGYVIEARSGANGQFVCATHPVRDNNLKKFTYNDESVDAINNASYMVIPAGGFAIVVNNDGTFGELAKFDLDGRGWLNKNLVRYGYAAKLYLDNAPQKLLNTTYTNHAPIVLSATTVSVEVNDNAAGAAIETTVKEGISYTDDNGTFTNADEVTSGLTITVEGASNPAFDISKVGDYVYTLKISDGELETTFTRTVNVHPGEATAPTLDIDGTWYEIGATAFAVNPTPATMAQGQVTNYNVIIYNSAYKGTRVENNYGLYFIVDANGKLVSMYSPWSGGFSTKSDSEVTHDTSVASTNVMNHSQIEIPAGGYLICAVNGYKAPEGSQAVRDALKDLVDTQAEVKAMFDRTFKLYKISWQPTIKATRTGGATEFVCTNIIMNEAAENATKASQSVLFYDTTYKGSIVCNTHGMAFVVDKETGKIVRFYDGANAKYYDADHAAGDGAASHGFGTGDFAQKAFESLQEGEYLIVCPNFGSNGSDTPRGFANSLKLNFQEWTISLVNFEITAASQD